MNEESKIALHLLTGTSKFEDVSVAELQQLAEEHPYFAAAHLLLLQKMHQLQDPGLQKQAHKTALFFPNQQWLHYFLFDSDYKNNIDFVSENVGIVNPNESKSSVETAIVSQVPAPIGEDEDIEAQEQETLLETEDSNLITIPAEQILEDIPADSNITDEPEEFPLDEEELQQQSEPLPIDESNQKIANLLSGQAEEFNKPIEETTEIPVQSEPFHTVDYFASQGIRLDAKREENAFDRKVHKFTDWLRQMKRINPHPVDLGTEEEEETFILNIADSSNHAKEILTESMAEVLVKQGKKDKAAEIYQKLSLLNPDKTTYFAALLQNIK